MNLHLKFVNMLNLMQLLSLKDHSTIGIGAGQQNRLDSCKIAVQKAKNFNQKNFLTQ